MLKRDEKSVTSLMSIAFCVLPLQRDRKERKHYTDDWALGDEEIEGRRSFRLDDKMESDRFPQCFVKEMVGSGMLMVVNSPFLQLKCWLK
jgi:hypothetical protein